MGLKDLSAPPASPDGCTSEQRRGIEEDVERANEMLGSAIAYLGQYDGETPRHVKKALEAHFAGRSGKWFGKWIHINLVYLRWASKLADYRCETTNESLWACTSENTLATTLWCVPGVDIRICFESGSGDAMSDDPTDRATTIIHEWVHKYGCNLDLGYEHEDGYDENGTTAQLFNADSFANFVRDASGGLSRNTGRIARKSAAQTLGVIRTSNRRGS